MPLEATFRNVEQHLRRLREHLSQLILTLVEDKPANGDFALADALAGAAHDLTGILDEALTAITDPNRVTDPSRTLMIVNERLNRFSQLFWSYFQSYERLAELNRVGLERDGQWRLWSHAVHQTIEGCRQPLYDAHAALLQCWQEVTEWALQNPLPDQAAGTRPLPLSLTSEEPATVEFRSPIMTGAQAALFHRTRAILTRVIPILNEHVSLRADLDPDRFQAVRAIIRTELEELMRELNRTGGPRVARADALFESLLGPHSETSSLAGQMQRLRDEMGLDRERADTVEEEWQETNFRILLDYIELLRRSWQETREVFLRDESSQANTPSKQLVELMRTLAIMTQSVREVKAVLDSVMVGPAERQNAILTIADTPSMSVADLLDWIEQFGASEGPHLIADAGLAALEVVAARLTLLCKLLNSGLLDVPADRLPAGYRDPRVRQALQRLADHIKQTIALARPVKNGPRVDELPLSES